MTRKIPAVSRETTQQALQRLALIKCAMDALKDEADFIKSYLNDALDQGDKKEVLADDGGSMATVSKTKDVESVNFTVHDPFAFADWLDERGIKHEAKPSLVFPSAFTRNDHMEALIESNGGEIPPGVNVSTTTKHSYVVARQTEKQKARVLEAVAAARHVIESARLTAADEEVEGGE